MPRYRVTDNLPALEEIRLRQGKERMRDTFHYLYEQNPDHTLRFLNDNALRYPSLYILQPEIAKLQLEENLSVWNRRALEISRKLTDRERVTYESTPEDFPVLQWMLQTGYEEENLGSQYDEIMDFTAILLVKEYHDKQCMGPLLEMIFKRHRRGLFTYDAEWAFFEGRDPECLLMVVNRLLSPEPMDVVLARRLLRFIPCFEDDDADPRQQYSCAMRWIENNRPYLRYTGESGLKGSNPTRFAIALDYKYLQQPLKDSGEASLSTQEQTKLQMFRQLDDEWQELLSECSQWLRAYSINQWEVWMDRPLDEQAELAWQLSQEGVLT